MLMRVIIRILAGLSLLGAIGWVYFQPGWESGLAIVATLSTLVGSFVGEKRKDPPTGQHQNVSGSGVGIQAGGDVTVGNIGQPQKDTRHV